MHHPRWLALGFRNHQQDVLKKLVHDILIAAPCRPSFVGPITSLHMGKGWVTLQPCLRAAKFCWDVFSNFWLWDVLDEMMRIHWLSTNVIDRYKVDFIPRSQNWSKPFIDRTPWDLSIKDKFPVWRFTHLHFSKEKGTTGKSHFI